jgi:hypothetical protein
MICIYTYKYMLYIIYAAAVLLIRLYNMKQQLHDLFTSKLPLTISEENKYRNKNTKLQFMLYTYLQNV